MHLPKSTFFNKKIPKQKFYENMNVNASLKRSFIDDIKAVYWRNKISPETINIGAGNTVKEIQVFLVELNKDIVHENVLLQIDREVPYHILYMLKFQNLYKVAIGYKEETLAGTNAYKVGTYYYTDWMEEEKLPIELKGLDLDKVYENLVRNIGGERLSLSKDDSLKDAVQKDDSVQKIERDIQKLVHKRQKTKQLNKKMKINDAIKALKTEIDQLR